MGNLAKVDPREFGLEATEVATIEQAFSPKIAEREAIAIIYEQLLTKEITKATCAEARDLRLKLVKVRTGISEVHKKQKAYFLAAGKFVDAWKNKETLPVQQMEERLVDIEKYYENLEKERIEKLAAEREAEIRKYSEVIPYDLGNMPQDIYDNYLTGVKVAMQARIKAEKEAEDERVRLEKIEKLNSERKNKTIRLVEFIDNYENLAFGEMSEEDFMILVNGAIKKRTEHEAEQERIKKENEKLKKEAEAKEKLLEKERAQAAAELKKQQEAAAKVAAELQAKKDAEIAEQKAKEAAEQKEKEDAELAAKAPRKEKLSKWVESFSIPDFEKDIVAEDILAKFGSFKNWAKSQVEKL